jgi:dihydroxynaphthoic acid synthetase
VSATHSFENYADILYRVESGVATLTINRPDKLNSFTPHTLREMAHAVRAAGNDKRVGVIVLTGAGDKAFCAGGDVNVENEDTFVGSGGAAAFDEIVKDLYSDVRACLKPVIARVNGYAIGGGNHLAYICDFTICSDKSVFGQNGPRVASPAEGWLVSYLWTVVGVKRAKEMWMLCRRYSAEQALQWGLVNAVVAEDELDAEVRRWADELLALSPTVLKLVKRSFDDSLADMRDTQDRFRILNQVNTEFFSSGEQAEGSQAFLERRKPDFSAYR